MALSGSFTGSTNNQYIQPKITWSAVQSVSGNYSDVTATLTYSRTNTGYTTKGTWSGSITINGSTSSGSRSVNITYNSNTTAISATVRVYHNNDGAKSITISATGGISGTTLTSTAISGSITLNTIPRSSAPSLSPSSVVMGNTITINTNPASASFSHTLTYSFGSLSGTIASGVGSSCSWTVPAYLANAIPNSTSGSGTITCKTYNGSTLIGTRSVTFTASVPPSVVPTISSVTITEAVNGLSAKFGAYVQNQSKLQVVVSASGASGSTISRYQTTIQGVSYSASSFTSGLITASGTVNIVTTVTDSRGRTASHTSSVTVLPYETPTISRFAVSRCDQLGDEDADGTRAKVTITFSISPVNDRNDKIYEVLYRQKGAASWISAATGNVYSYNGSIITGAVFNTDLAYDVALVVTDYFKSARAESDVSTSFSLIDYHHSGTGLAFGKVAETSNLIDSALPILARNGVSYPVIAPGSDLDSVIKPGFYAGYSTSADPVLNCPVTPADFTIEVKQAGDGGSLYQKWTLCDKDGSVSYERFYYQSAWGSWRKIKDFAGALLWSGGLYMQSDHTVSLAENVSQQPRGIVLVFSPYANGSAQNDGFCEFFVHKQIVGANSGAAHSFILSDSAFAHIASKRLTITDGAIAGHADNISTGTANGITYANDSFVLRYVIGV